MTLAQICTVDRIRATMIERNVFGCKDDLNTCCSLRGICLLEMYIYICSLLGLYCMYRLPQLIYPEGISCGRAYFCLAFKRGKRWDGVTRVTDTSRRNSFSKVFLCKHVCDMQQNDKFHYVFIGKFVIRKHHSQLASKSFHILSSNDCSS